jgi:hypothetical protein
MASVVPQEMKLKLELPGNLSCLISVTLGTISTALS